MDNILDKLGIYDLLAILFAGISVLTITTLVLHFIYHISINTDWVINPILVILVVGYFIGLVLQEIGWLIYAERLFANRKLLKEVLSSDAKSVYYITGPEKAGVYTYIKSQMNAKEIDENVVYNYCKLLLIQKYDMSRFDKDQSLSAMSRSFALYFFMLTVVSLFSLFSCFTFPRLCLCIASSALVAMFHNRCVRFAKMRYCNIIRTFYYNEQDAIKSVNKM